MLATERFPAIPLACWIDRQVDRLSNEFDGPERVLAAQMGISPRVLYCWKRELMSEGQPAFSHPAPSIEAALARAGVHLHEVFYLAEPEVTLHEGYCTRCEQIVGATAKGRCLWCDGPISRTTHNAERIVRKHRICIDCRGPKSVGGLRCRPCYDHRQEKYGWFRRSTGAYSENPDRNVCPGCGGSKEWRALRCRPCYLEAGGFRGTRLEADRLAAISPALLEEARRLYFDEMLSVTEVAEAILARTSYANLISCKNALYAAFKVRGWQVRSRGEATRLRLLAA